MTSNDLPSKREAYYVLSTSDVLAIAIIISSHFCTAVDL